MHRKHLCLAFLLSSLTTAFSIAASPIQPGDRIAIVGNTFADQLRIHGYLETLLLQHTRNAPVTLRNLGWGGDMVQARDRPTGFPTEESMLFEHKTDVIVACFGMGESFAGEAGLEEFKTQLNAFLQSHAGKKYNGETDVRLVLVSPIACEDLGNLTLARDQRNKELESYTAAMREVATTSDVPFVDLFDASRYLMNEEVGPQLTHNGIHLNAYGYWAISHAFFDRLTDNSRLPNQPSWSLRIDIATQSADARGVQITELSADDSGVSFRAAETSPPRLSPPTAQPLPPQLELARDTLVVENLPNGKYQLTIDGTPVVTASAQAWAEGVAIDSSPTHQACEAFRAVTNDKNLQFTYSWKAINQVHIVGERRGSPSGKAIPKELQEFRKITEDLDQKLKQGVELKTRRWRIARSSD